MGILRGILTIVFIILVAGFIAYVGDRVGHQVGRRRLTLFNLRPRYTSTIVAVATGMLIATLVTVIAGAASEYVQTALFRIGDLNAQMRELQAKVASMQQEVDKTRNEPRILPFGEPIWNEFLIIQPTQSATQQFDAFSAFFDETVKAANRTWTPAGLRAFPQTAADSDVQRKLREQLLLLEPQLARSPVLLLPVASQNLFRGDTIGFEFDQYADVRDLTAHEVVAQLNVAGGAPVDFPRLIALARDDAIRRGMPPPFVTFPLVNGTQAQSIAQQVAHSKGNFVVVAKAAQDTYPHSRALILDFGIETR
jgi:outer membrane murein-binding lipoprotein Lpp